MLRIGGSDVGPISSAVGRFLHSVGGGNGGAQVGLAGADVNNVRIGRRESDGPDRSNGLGVKNGIPGAAGVVGFPNAATNGAEIVDLRLAAHAGDSDDASGARRPDGAPAEFLKQLRIEL